MKFTNRVEAQLKADKKNRNQKPEEFCPLIIDVCRKDCVCFIDAFVMNCVENEYTTRGFLCGNEMFSRK